MLQQLLCMESRTKKKQESQIQVGVTANEDVHFSLINDRTFEHIS